MHRLRADSVDEHFAILRAAAKHVMAGGQRRACTAPALIFAALQLVRQKQAGAEASASSQEVRTKEASRVWDAAHGSSLARLCTPCLHSPDAARATSSVHSTGPAELSVGCRCCNS